MNDFNLINFLSATGFFTLVYFVARLLNNWFNFRRDRYSDEEDHPIADLFTIVLFFIFGILYLISFPITTISYFIHTSTVKMAIEEYKRESYEKEKEIRELLEKVAYDEGYKEGRESGCKVGYRKGYEIGWGKGYDNGYEVANTSSLDTYNIQEFEKHKHLDLVNPYTSESLITQYDYIKFIKRKNEIEQEIQNER